MLYESDLEVARSAMDCDVDETGAKLSDKQGGNRGLQCHFNLRI